MGKPRKGLRVFASSALVGCAALLLQPHSAAVPPAPSPIDLLESMGTGRPTPERLDAALTVLTDPEAFDVLLVRTAIGLAGAFRDERAEPGLASVVAGGPGAGGAFDDHTRMAAANAVGRIGGAVSFPSVAVTTAPPFLAGVPPGRGNGRGAERCPGSDSPPPCPPPGAAERSFRGFSEQTVDVLLACAVPGDGRRVRAACIQALGRGRTDDAVPTLEGIANDPDEDPFLVLAAQRALSQILENSHVTETAVDAALLEALRYVGVAP